MRNAFVRSASLFVFFGAVAAANADVRYTLTGPLEGFSITTSSFITATQTFSGSQIDSGGVFLSSLDSVTLSPAGPFTDKVTIDFSVLGIYPGNETFYFKNGALGAYGTYVGTNLLYPATLVVSEVSTPAAVAPAPAAIVPFALGLLAKRRRKA